MIIRQWQDVIDGRKTQTRRVLPINAVSFCSDDDDDAIDAISVRGKDGKFRLKWRVGNVYAMVPKMGKPGVGFYRITSLRVERLQDISEDDARAEGIMKVFTEDNRAWCFSRGLEDYPRSNAVDAYKVLWESLGARWSDNPYVAVIGIEYMGATK